MNCVVNDLKIIIKDDVLEKITNCLNRNTKFETGGILLGKFSRENKTIEVEEVHEIKTSLFSRTMYKRHVKTAQKIIDQRWKKSEGIINYLGEWHTHPGMHAIPSNTDIASLEDISLKTNSILPGTIMIIAGKCMEMGLIVQKKNGAKLFLFQYPGI